VDGNRELEDVAAEMSGLVKELKSHWGAEA